MLNDHVYGVTNIFIIYTNSYNVMAIVSHRRSQRTGFQTKVFDECFRNRDILVAIYYHDLQNILFRITYDVSLLHLWHETSFISNELAVQCFNGCAWCPDNYWHSRVTGE